MQSNINYSNEQPFNIINQEHLNNKDTINLGSYYTNKKLVDCVYSLIQKNTLINKYTFLDTSCGYGAFLQNKIDNCKFIGGDIDEIAIKKAKSINNNVEFFKNNALLNISREKYNIKDDEKLIILGNPPYNDTTSLIKNDIKQEVCNIDKDIKTRDLGISFLLSYNKLNPDYICVLHPLSYLIKKANFDLLRDFSKNYVLKDCLVVSSGEFSNTSKTTFFPIIIAFYEKNGQGMNYDYIKNYDFKTIENNVFKINNFDYINNYISKYPNKSVLKDSNIYFWTMRDINALKRSKTFTQERTYNSIVVDIEKLDYYCYVDIFKDYIKHIPYYFGNCDIMINNEKFKEIKDYFVYLSLEKNLFLKEIVDIELNFNKEEVKMVVDDYFVELLGLNYVY